MTAFFTHNDAGAVAFSYGLASGGAGVAVVPETNTLALTLAGEIIALVSVARRRKIAAH